MTENEICKALELCSTDETVHSCKECPYNTRDDSSCVREMCKGAVELIKKQQEKIDMLEVIKKLNEQDIADRDEMLKQKVEVVYEDFMKDYKCILEENEGIYKELAEARAEIERLRNGKDKKHTPRPDGRTIAQTIIDEVPHTDYQKKAVEFLKELAPGYPEHTYKLTAVNLEAMCQSSPYEKLINEVSERLNGRATPYVTIEMNIKAVDKEEYLKMHQSYKS